MRFVLALLVTGCVASAPPLPQFAGVPAVSYCESIKNQGAYNGKIVRVHGYYGAGMEASFIFDPACRERSWAEFDDAVNKQTARRVMRLFQWTDPPDKVTVVARFRVSETYELLGHKVRRGFGHLNAYDTQLDILSIERVRRLHFDPRH